MKHSERLQKVWDELQEEHEEDDAKIAALDDSADSTCTTGSDNDGSSGFDIFENGFQLAEKAAGRPVFYVDLGEEDVSLFFIGSEDEIEAKLRAAVT